jgi:hypothetical protein
MPVDYERFIEFFSEEVGKILLQKTDNAAIPPTRKIRRANNRAGQEL